MENLDKQQKLQKITLIVKSMCSAQNQNTMEMMKGSKEPGIEIFIEVYEKCILEENAEMDIIYTKFVNGVRKALDEKLTDKEVDYLYDMYHHPLFLTMNSKLTAINTPHASEFAVDINRLIQKKMKEAA